MHHDPLQQHQCDCIMSTDGRENDEDLVLFQEVQKRESEAMLKPMVPPLRERRPDVVSPEDAGEDILAASEWDEHDYDWLMTPPVTLPLSRLEQNAPVSNGSVSEQSVTVKNASKSIAKVGGDNSGARPLAQAARRSFDMHKPAGPNVSLGMTKSSVSRKSFSAATRSSTPSHGTSVSRPIARPSPPSKSVQSSASARSSTPTGWAASPSHCSVSSTRPLAPIKRPVTPTRVNGPLPASLKPSSVNKTVSLSAKSASGMRPSGPAFRAQLPATHSVVLSELPHESPPPKLHSSVANRPLSNPRGSLALKHNVKAATAKATQPRSAEVCLHNRGSSSLSMVARGRVSSKSLNMENASSRHEKPHDATMVSTSHGAGSKIAGKNMPPTRPLPLSQEKARFAAVNTPAKKTVQTASPREKQASSVVQQSSGFGRKMSKSSLDMALRHMDIQGSMTSGVQSFMSNVPKSSLYSVRSRNSRGISNGRGNSASLITRSPMATSSNASSECSMSLAVIDLESSDFGDETSSSKASPVSQPDLSMAMSNDRKVSFWLGGPGYMGDDGADILKNFEHELASLSGTESPLVSQPDGNIDVDDFTLEPI